MPSLEFSGDISIVGAGPGDIVPDIPPSLEQFLQSPGTLGTQYVLTGNAPVVVNFGGLPQATFVYLSVQGGNIVAVVSSSAGANQDVPVDQVMILGSRQQPITALSLIGQANQTITVNVFIGNGS